MNFNGTTVVTRETSAKRIINRRKIQVDISPLGNSISDHIKPNLLMLDEFQMSFSGRAAMGIIIISKQRGH